MIGEQVPLLYNGPYAQAYGYDVWGNRTHLEGWGGVGRAEDPTYTNNRRNGMQYDAAGNLVDGNWFTFSYDAASYYHFRESSRSSNHCLRHHLKIIGK